VQRGAHGARRIEVPRAHAQRLILSGLTWPCTDSPSVDGHRRRISRRNSRRSTDAASCAGPGTASRRALRWRCCRDVICLPLLRSATIPSRSVWRRVIRLRMASCCGPGWLPNRPTRPAWAVARSRSGGEWPLTAACVTWWRAGRRGPRRYWRTRSTSRSTGSTLAGTTFISSTCVRRRAPSGTSARLLIRMSCSARCSLHSPRARIGRAAITRRTVTARERSRSGATPW
jgi:hypothetical protein